MGPCAVTEAATGQTERGGARARWSRVGPGPSATSHLRDSHPMSTDLGLSPKLLHPPCWFNRASGGIAARDNFGPMGAWVGGLSVFSILACAHFTRDQIPHLTKAQALPRLTARAFMSDVGGCLSNRNYRMLLFGLVLLGGTLGIRETLDAYLALFFWELPAEKIRLFNLATPPAYLVAFILAPGLHRLLDKREAIVAAVCGLALAVSVPVANARAARCLACSC